MQSGLNVRSPYVPLHDPLDPVFPKFESAEQLVHLWVDISTEERPTCEFAEYLHPFVWGLVVSLVQRSLILGPERSATFVAAKKPGQEMGAFAAVTGRTRAPGAPYFHRHLNLVEQFLWHCGLVETLEVFVLVSYLSVVEPTLEYIRILHGAKSRPSTSANSPNISALRLPLVRYPN